MAVIPKLSDIQLDHPNIKPGDRMIVRTPILLSYYKQRSLVTSVQKSVGDHVRLIVVPVNLVWLSIQVGDYIEDLASWRHVELQVGVTPGVMNLNCGQVEIPFGAKFLVKWQKGITDDQKKGFLMALEHWTDKVCEIVIQEDVNE